jgi:hypothetical protein
MVWSRGFERILRVNVDVDEEQPVVVMLVGLSEPVEGKGAVAGQCCKPSNVIGSSGAGFGMIDYFLESTVDLTRIPIYHRIHKIVLMVFCVRGPPLIPVVLIQLHGDVGAIGRALYTTLHHGRPSTAIPAPLARIGLSGRK